MSTLTIAAGVGVAGIIGGVIAERVVSPDTISKSKAGDAWGKLHDDFLTSHPAPKGTQVFTASMPAWKNAAVLGGAAAGVALLGGAAFILANRMPLVGGQPGAFAMALGIAGLLAAVGGAGVLAGTAGSWAIR